MICWRIDTDDITIDNTDAFLLNKASIFHVAGHYEVFYCILLHVHSVRLNQYYRCRCNHMKRLKFIHVAHYFFFLSILAHSPQDLWKINVQSTREGVNLWLSSQELFIWVFMYLRFPNWFFWFCCSVLDCYKEKSNQGCKKRTQGFEKSSKRKQGCKSDEVC